MRKPLCLYSSLVFPLSNSTSIGPFVFLAPVLTLCLVLLDLGTAIPTLAKNSSTCSSNIWEHFPSNVWVKLPTCGPVPRKVFHGAATLAEHRGEVFFFGADTHDLDYDNSVTRLNLENLKWARDYEPDPIETYGVTQEGYPITKTGRPWATHAFDTWDYHPPTQTIIFVGFPKHAHKAKQILSQKGADLQKLKPATWIYSPQSHNWRILDISTPFLFAQGLVWNPITSQFIGHNGEKTFLFSLSENKWNTIEASSTLGWHHRLIFETGKNRILSLGINTGSGDLWAYSPQVKKWEEVPVDNTPLPANGAAMAYDSSHQVLLYLANDYEDAYDNPSGKSITFLFFSSTQSWKKLNIPSPPLFGMNYLTQYDPVRDVFLHFEKASPKDQSLAIWAFKFSK